MRKSFREKLAFSAYPIHPFYHCKTDDGVCGNSQRCVTTIYAVTIVVLVHARIVLVLGKEIDLCC